MKPVASFSRLLRCDSDSVWSKLVFKLGADLGFTGVLLAVFPNRNVPLESRFAFLRSNYAPSWRTIYDQEDFWHSDPTVSHCLTRTTPLVWTSRTFAGETRQIYDAGCRHGLRTGISFPMHGAGGEVGVLSFATDAVPDRRFRSDAQEKLPVLSCLRDYVLESSRQFMTQPKDAAALPALTPRELECLNWSAAGKTSWEIAQILRCSEATVNFHLKNLRGKFNVTSRQQAVVKAIRMGILAA